MIISLKKKRTTLYYIVYSEKCNIHFENKKTAVIPSAKILKLLY